MHDFTDLITAYAWTRDADRRRDIGERIWRWFGVEGAVLVVDLCGFSRRAIGDAGILDFLAVIRRMQAAVRPIVWMHEGEIVKMEADNCFAFFPSADGAVKAALELVDASRTIRAAEHIPLEVCCGIESGRLLYLKEKDFFGGAVNLASRLGEDLAQCDEILVGPTARAGLAADGWRFADLDRIDAPAGAGRLLAP